MNFKYKIIHKDTGELATVSDEFIENCAGHFGGFWGSLDTEGNPLFICVENVIPLEQLREEKLAELKQIATSKLQPTDYKTLKFIEGELTAEEFAPIKADRQVIRDKYNQLETQANNAKTQDELAKVIWEG